MNNNFEYVKKIIDSCDIILEDAVISKELLLQEYADFISHRLNSYFLNSKVLKRENKYMIYVKEAEKIGDFLRMINAIRASHMAERYHRWGLMQSPVNMFRMSSFHDDVFSYSIH